MLLSALLLALAPIDDLHRDELHGFEIAVPEGWSTYGEDRGEKGYVFGVLPPGSQGERAVVLSVLDLEPGTGVERMVEDLRESLDADPRRHSEYREWREELAGREALCAGLLIDETSGAYRVELRWLVEGDRGFQVQCYAPQAEFEQLAPRFREVLDSFTPFELSAEARVERRLAGLAARCGSEVDWAASWEEAARRAREGDRLVLVAAFLLHGFAIPMTPRHTLFMDPDVIELVNERYVPLWYTSGMPGAFVESYGLSPTTLGQGLLLVTPEGEVVLETNVSSDVDIGYAFLREALARHPEFAAEPLPEGLASLERAGQLVARGELESALGLLAELETGKAHRQRARVLRLLRRGEKALAALAAAREAGGVPEDELLVEEAGLWMRAGREVQAAAACERVLGEFPDGERRAEARLLLGLLDLRVRDLPSAKLHWRAIVDEGDEDDRWAWQAAALLGNTLLDADLRPDFSWPDEAVVAEVLAFNEPTPLKPDRAGEALEGALSWLLANQRSDGSWISQTQLNSVEEMGPDPFVDAITALAARALLRRGSDEGAREAAGRAIAYLQASIEERQRTPPRILFMDFMTWSDAMMLVALADALEAGLGEEEGLSAAALALTVDLSRRQVRDGGWSYYISTDLAGDDVPTQSISFTTAAGVLGLARAREVGFEVPAEALERAASALARMRDEEGVFAYFLHPDPDQVGGETADPGAVGRGPACELALARTGRSDERRLRGSLKRFFEHAHLFAAEQGKAFMHAGPHAQGCHYLLFDYAHAALVQELLPPDPETRVRILELLLDCRQPDGSFFDTPINGRAYGTAMALLALDALEVERAGAPR